MPETDLRARSAADYLRMLQHLLPQGQAWTRAPGAVLTAVLQASADELERLDMAMRLLLMEILPTSAIAGLEDWERVLGLPDACLPAGTTLQERRSAVLAKLRDEGRQDLAYWYGVADSLEYDVTIEEHWPFCCGIHQCADPSGLTPEEIWPCRRSAGGGTSSSTATGCSASAAARACAVSCSWTGAPPPPWSASCCATNWPTPC